MPFNKFSSFYPSPDSPLGRGIAKSTTTSTVAHAHAGIASIDSEPQQPVTPPPNLTTPINTGDSIDSNVNLAKQLRYRENATPKDVETVKTSLLNFFRNSDVSSDDKLNLIDKLLEFTKHPKASTAYLTIIEEVIPHFFKNSCFCDVFKLIVAHTILFYACISDAKPVYFNIITEVLPDFFSNSDVSKEHKLELANKVLTIAKAPKTSPSLLNILKMVLPTILLSLAQLPIDEMNKLKLSDDQKQMLQQLRGLPNIDAHILFEMAKLGTVVKQGIAVDSISNTPGGAHHSLSKYTIKEAIDMTLRVFFQDRPIRDICKELIEDIVSDSPTTQPNQS